jgi:hypothetical protein
MAKIKPYEILIDGEQIEALLFMWSARLDRLYHWLNNANRTEPMYDELLRVKNVSNTAHTELSSLHFYKKRYESTSPNVRRQLAVATQKHHEACALYLQLLELRSG